MSYGIMEGVVCMNEVRSSPKTVIPIVPKVTCVPRFRHNRIQSART